MTPVLGYVSLNICDIDAIRSSLDAKQKCIQGSDIQKFDQVIRYLDIVNFGILNSQAVRPNVKPNRSQVKN